MLRKFKLTALTYRHKNGKRHSIYTTYVINAHDPFDARAKALAKYPGRHFITISECYPNGNIMVGRTWTAASLAARKAEIKIKYDFEML